MRLLESSLVFTCEGLAISRALHTSDRQKNTSFFSFCAILISPKIEFEKTFISIIDIINNNKIISFKNYLLFPAHERFLIGRDPHGISAIYLIIYIADIPSAVGSLLYVRPPQDRLSIRIFGISVAFHPFGVANLRLLFGIFVINKRLKCSLSDVSEIIRINPNRSERFHPKPSAMFLSIDKR